MELKNIIILLRDQLNDLATWSVENDDKYNQEVADIERILDVIDFRSEPRCKKCGEIIRGEGLCYKCAR